MARQHEARARVNGGGAGEAAPATSARHPWRPRGGTACSGAKWIFRGLACLAVSLLPEPLSPTKQRHAAAPDSACLAAVSAAEKMCAGSASTPAQDTAVSAALAPCSAAEASEPLRVWRRILGATHLYGSLPTCDFFLPPPPRVPLAMTAAGYQLFAREQVQFGVW